MPAAEPTTNVSRTCLVILAVIASGAAIYWMAAILTPPAMAMFLAIVIDGFARVLKRRFPWITWDTVRPFESPSSACVRAAGVTPYSAARP